MQKNLSFTLKNHEREKNQLIFTTQFLRRSEEEEDRGTMRVAFGYADENESMDSNFEA